MPEADPRSTYDSSIIKTESRKITTKMVEDHEEALKTEVPVAAFIASLAKLEPAKAAALTAKLDKYHNGQLNANAVYTLAKLDVGNQHVLTAFMELAPGFDRAHCFPSGVPHPILV